MSGTFTFSDHQNFRVVLEKIADNNIRDIHLHMENIEFIDSAALGMLLLANDEADRFHKKVVIAGAQGQVKKMFDAARFGTLFTIR